MPEPTGAATLTWTHNGATGYRIVYGRTATALTQVIQINSGTQRTFTVNGLPAGTHYFAVKAFSDGNESAPSNVLSKVVAP